jgi:hypothetical protein
LNIAEQCFGVIDQGEDGPVVKRIGVQVPKGVANTAGQFRQ